MCSDISNRRSSYAINFIVENNKIKWSVSQLLCFVIEYKKNKQTIDKKFIFCVLYFVNYFQQAEVCKQNNTTWTYLVLSISIC